MNTDNNNVVTTQPQDGGQQQMGPGPGGLTLQPVIQQIQHFMPVPIPGVPTGLEFLHSVPQVIIHPEDMMGVMTFVFSILDGQFNRLYGLSYTLESMGLCCTSSPFIVSCQNYMGQEVFGGRGVFNCWHRGRVSIGQGEQVYGSNGSSWTPCGKHYKIKDAAGKVVFDVKGMGPPEYYCCSDCCGSLKYDVTGGPTPLQIVGEDVSNVVFKLRWTITFPEGMDVKMKAVWIGLIILFNNEHHLAQKRKVHKIMHAGRYG